MAAAARRLGLRAPFLLRDPASALAADATSVLLRAPASFLAAAGASRSASTAASAGASRSGSTAARAGEAPSVNIIWLQREASKVSASQAAELDALHRETIAMSAELDRAAARHAAALSDCKLAAAETVAWSCVAGGAFLLAAFILMQ